MKKSSQLPIFTDAWYDALCVEGLCKGANPRQHSKCKQSKCPAGEFNDMDKTLPKGRASSAKTVGKI